MNYKFIALLVAISLNAFSHIFADPDSPVRPKAPAPTFTTPSPAKRTTHVAQVTPCVRSVSYKFDIAWPTNLQEGGKITITQEAKNKIFNDYRTLRDWKTTKKEPDFNQLGLLAHNRVIDSLNIKLIKEIATERSFTPSATMTPEKERIDHAFSYDMIVRSLDFCRAYTGYDRYGVRNLFMVIPVDVSYFYISKKHHLTRWGLIRLTFSYPNNSSKYRKSLSYLTESRKAATTEKQQALLSQADNAVKHPYLLFHACLHANNPYNANNINNHLTPANVTLHYDDTDKVLYFSFD